MKLARFVLKIVAASLAAAAAVCCIIAYWDKIAACFCSTRNLVTEKAKQKVHLPSEYDDYADWELE